MKKIITALVVTLCAASAMASYTNTWSITLTTTNAIVAPDLNKSFTNVWATGSIDAGSYRLNSSSRKYWTPNGGTATSGQEPTHTLGVATGTDSIQWVALKRKRETITVQLVESGDAWIIASGSAAAPNTGHLLTGKAMGWGFDNYSGEINAVAGSTTKVITVTPRY
jgi:hypothetical protein